MWATCRARCGSTSADDQRRVPAGLTHCPGTLPRGLPHGTPRGVMCNGAKPISATRPGQCAHIRGHSRAACRRLTPRDLTSRSAGRARTIIVRSRRGALFHAMYSRIEPGGPAGCGAMRSPPPSHRIVAAHAPKPGSIESSRCSNSSREAARVAPRGNACFNRRRNVTPCSSCTRWSCC